MGEISLWLKDVLLIIISLTFFQTLLPDSNMSKYLKYIFSLIILVVIVEPLIYLFEKL